MADHIGTFIWIDDGKRYGGGQLSLLRYLDETSLSRRTKVVSLMGGKFAAALQTKPEQCQILHWNGHLLSTLRTIQLLRKYLSTLSKQDVVVFNSLTAAILVRLASLGLRALPTQFYYMREDLTTETLHGLKRSLVLRAVLPHCDGFIVNSHWTASVIPSTLSSVPYRVCYPVSGLRDVHIHSTKEPETSPRVFEFVTLSRLTHWKGIDIALEALHLLVDMLPRQDADGTPTPSVRLKIAGVGMPNDDEYVRSLQQYSDDNHLPVEFLGHVDDIYSLLSTADALILPSRQPEPYGQVVVQALAAGTIVIASAAGGPKEIISQDVNGLLFNLGSASSLADQMISVIMTSDAERNRLRKAAIRTAVKYQDSATTLAVDEVLSSARHWSKKQNGEAK